MISIARNQNAKVDNRAFTVDKSSLQEIKRVRMGSELSNKSQAHSIVVLGDFNPIIFQPLWLSSNDMLPKKDVDEVENPIISREVTAYDVAGFHLQVDQQRIVISTRDDSRIPIIRDIVLGSLTLLEHTPLRAIGFNFELHATMVSEAAWHSLGHFLAPKKAWSDLIESPGMQSISMLGKRKNCSADSLSITVKPSRPPSVVASINQHYNLLQELNRERNKKAIQILQEDWPGFLTFGKESALEILSSAPSIELHQKG